MLERIQRCRTPGWRMPPGAIYVGRPGPFGNPFPKDGDWAVWAAVARGFRADPPGRRAAAVAHYREWLLGQPAKGPDFDDKGNDLIEFESGIVLSTDEHCRGFAGFAASELYRITVPTPPTLERIRAELRGHDLACWCPLGQPCHADVLLELANG